MALRLPLAHVDWFAEQPRTCHEYFLLLAGQVTRPNDPRRSKRLVVGLRMNTRSKPTIEYRPNQQLCGTHNRRPTKIYEGVQKMAAGHAGLHIGAGTHQQRAYRKRGGDCSTYPRLLRKRDCVPSKIVGSTDCHPSTNGILRDASGGSEDIKQGTGL